MARLSVCLIICILILNGCTIEKRKYSSGYHTTWNVQHLFPKGNGANQFQREESKPLFSPKPASINESAVLPIFSDSTINKESKKHTDLDLTSNKKTQRLVPSVSDTVPEVKKKVRATQNTVDLLDQLEFDKKLVAHAWLGLLISVVAYIASIALIFDTDFEIAFFLLYPLGIIGGIVSIILIIVFTILKIKHKNQIKLNQKRHELVTNPSNQANTKSKQEIDTRIAKIDQTLKKLNIIRIIFGIGSIYTFFILYPIGILSFIVFLIATWRRNRLKEERYLLPYQEG